VPDETHCGTPVLHKDGCFTCGLGQFVAVDWTPPAEVPDKDYPFVLSTGRRLFHYHTRTQTGRAAGLNEILGEETADISPQDAQAMGIADGEMIRVKSRRGEVTVEGQGDRPRPPGPRVDGLPFPRSLCQLAHQPGLRSRHPNGGI